LIFGGAPNCRWGSTHFHETRCQADCIWLRRYLVGADKFLRCSYHPLEFPKKTQGIYTNGFATVSNVHELGVLIQIDVRELKMILEIPIPGGPWHTEYGEVVRERHPRTICIASRVKLLLCLDIFRDRPLVAVQFGVLESRFQASISAFNLVAYSSYVRRP